MNKEDLKNDKNVIRRNLLTKYWLVFLCCILRVTGRCDLSLLANYKRDNVMINTICFVVCDVEKLV